MAGRNRNKELIKEIKSGNEEVLLHLFKKYYKDLKRIFHSYSIKESDMPSLASAVLVQIWMEIQQNDFSENIDLPSYILNTGKEMGQKTAEERKERRKDRNKEVVEVQMPRDIIAECVNVLDPAAKQALQLRYAENKSVDEVAARLNKDISAAHELLFKAFDQLSAIVKIRMGTV